MHALASTALLLTLAGGGDTTQDEKGRVAELERTVEALKGQLDDLRERQDAADELEEWIEELEAELQVVRDAGDLARPGTTQYAISGDAYTQYRNIEGGSSTFFAAYEPHFFWKIDDRLSFGSGVEFEIGLEDDDPTEPEDDLEIVVAWALLSYNLTNEITLGMGQFLSPFGYYQENIHAQFVNKLPSKPLAIDDDDRGLVPLHDTGFQARGPIILDEKSRLTWVLWVGNGMALETDNDEDAGRLVSDNFSDNNHNKGIGGRLGYRPRPSTEFGYSYMDMRVGDDSSAYSDIESTMQAVDANFTSPIERLDGRIDLRAEWIWSETDEADFGSGAFDNDRDGGYLQAAYRPTGRGSWLDDLEAIVRYDKLNEPSGGPAFDEERWTFGLTYWLHSFSAVKVAWAASSVDGDDDLDTFFIEYVIGF